MGFKIMNITEIIYVRNIDEQLIGKEICGYKLCKSYINDRSPENMLDNNVYVWDYANRLFDYHGDYNEKFAINDSNGSYYLYFKKSHIAKNIDDFYNKCDTDSFIQCLILFKEEHLQLSLPYFMFSNNGHTYIKINLYKYYVPKGGPTYTLSNEEINEINNFYEIYINFKSKENIKQIINMINIYNQARTIDMLELQLLLNITIIEMFIGAKYEISYQISKGVATFFAENYDEYKKISKEITNIYKARSRFIHSGNTNNITVETYRIANFYTRSIIKKLIEYNVTYNLSLSEIQTIMKNIGVLSTELEHRIIIECKNQQNLTQNLKNTK